LPKIVQKDKTSPDLAQQVPLKVIPQLLKIKIGLHCCRKIASIDQIIEINIGESF